MINEPSTRAQAYATSDIPTNDDSRRMSDLRHAGPQSAALRDAAQQSREAPPIVGMLCSTPAVPPRKVQAVVVSAVLVVHVVMQSRGKPPSPPGRKPASRLELDATVTGDVAHDLMSHPDEENGRVRRHEKQKERQECGLHGCFTDREGVCSPLSWRYREMMRPVYPPKDARSMHPAVRPVEVGIVRDDDQHKTSAPIQPSVTCRFRVHVEEAVLRAVVQTEPDKGGDDRGHEGVTHRVPTLVRTG